MGRVAAACDDERAMSTSSSVPRQVRRARRSADDAYLGGVAGGLGAHLGVDPTLVRMFFLVTSVVGFGPLLYAGLWLTLPLETYPEERSPGLDSATRRGLRTGRRRRLRDRGVLVAAGVVLVGLFGLLEAFVGRPFAFWPLVLAVGGVMVLWRQADEAQRERWLDSSGRVSVQQVFLGGGGAAAWARLATGVGLLVVALLLFAARTGRVAAALDVVLAGVLGVVGIALTLGPWLTRILSDLTTERAARIRSQERADVAAHLHDSVLQTLALIQRSAADPGTVTRLARAQERDLREWMFGDPAGRDSAAPTSLAAALRAVAGEVEAAHGTPVEVVTVGDVESGGGAGDGDADLQALVAAVRESVTNAARHSGAARVDVYAEVVPGASGWESVEVFVRDRGRGFDPSAVPPDRHGVRSSIVDRVQRHGGTAAVRSAPGDGTEVRLALPRRGSDGRRQGRSG